MWNLLLVIFTGTLAFVAVEQFFLTKRQVHISEVTEQSYVSFDLPTLDLDTGEIMIPVENVGHTPSGLGVLQVNVGLIKQTDKSHHEVLDVERLEAPIGGVPPNKPNELKERLSFKNWSSDHAEAISKDAEYVAVAGMINYDNNFGPTTSVFCCRSRHFGKSTELMWAICDPMAIGRELDRAWNERHKDSHP